MVCDEFSFKTVSIIYKLKCFGIKYLFLVLSFLISCESTKKTTTVKEIYEEEVFAHKDKIVGNDFISGKVMDDKEKPIYPVAIKLTIDNNTCLNAYTNFDGIFALTLDVSKINDNSYFEIVSKESKKTVLFNKFIKNKIVILDKNGKIITEEAYLYFLEKIRNCRQ